MGKYIPVEPEKWAEMVKAMAEVTRLKEEVKLLTAEVSFDKRVQLHVDKLVAEFTQCQVERLQAEVERLRKAGDALQKRLIFLHDRWDSDEPNIESDAWNAAKEGKQP